MNKLRVVGLDPSLSSFGLSDGDEHEAIRTFPVDPLEERLEKILCGVRQFVAGPRRAHLAVLEGSAFGAKGSGQEELATVRNMTRHLLWMHTIPYILVAPATLKKCTTGSGVASKETMVAVVDALYGTNFTNTPLSWGRTDMADALALAAFGYYVAGKPLPVSGRCTMTGSNQFVGAKYSAPYEGAIQAVRDLVKVGELT